MTVKNKIETAKVKGNFLSLLDERPLTLFFIIFLISLTLGSIIFVALLLKVEWPAALQALFAPDLHLDARGAGGFLQGAWGTAGSLAASFVAIVLARQAILLTKKQDESQDVTNARFESIQLEQNSILTRSTPEYAVSFAAAASSMRLDTLQIVIGTHERKKYRQAKPTVSDIFAKYSNDDLQTEVKINIRSELLNSQLMKLAGEIAEKTRGPQTKLYLEALAAEIVLESRFSVDKLLINEFTNLLRSLVSKAHKKITAVLSQPEATKIDYLASHQRYSKKNDDTGLGPAQTNPVGISKILSEPAYYFTYILQQQQRLSNYTYNESRLLENLAAQALNNSEIPIFIDREVFDFSAKTETSSCFVTAFDFNRGKILSELEFNNIKFSEPERGRPDLAICGALENTGHQPQYFLIDQIEQHTDSIDNSGKWLTFQEHLHIWLSAKAIIELIDAAPSSEPNPPHLELRQQLGFQQAIQNFVLGYGRASSKLNTTDINDLFPRFHEIENGAKLTLSRFDGNNYFSMLEEISESLGFEKNRGSAATLFRFFLIELFSWLDQASLENQAHGEIILNYQRITNDPENRLAISLLRTLAKRPYFERPFYGWYLPNRVCPRSVFDEARAHFIGIYYLTSLDEKYLFEANPLFMWLSTTHKKNIAVNRVHLL